jgi:hypothetical protein
MDASDEGDKSNRVHHGTGNDCSLRAVKPEILGGFGSCFQRRESMNDEFGDAGRPRSCEQQGPRMNVGRHWKRHRNITQRILLQICSSLSETVVIVAAGNETSLRRDN